MPLVMFILLALIDSDGSSLRDHVPEAAQQTKGKLCYHFWDVCCWTSTAALGTLGAPHGAKKINARVVNIY